MGDSLSFRCAAAGRAFAVQLVDDTPELNSVHSARQRFQNPPHRRRNRSPFGLFQVQPQSAGLLGTGAQQSNAGDQRMNAQAEMHEAVVHRPQALGRIGLLAEAIDERRGLLAAQLGEAQSPPQRQGAGGFSSMTSPPVSNTSIVVSRCGKSLAGRGQGRRAVARSRRATHVSLTGQAPHNGARLRHKRAPGSMSPWV